MAELVLTTELARPGNVSRRKNDYYTGNVKAKSSTGIRSFRAMPLIELVLTAELTRPRIKKKGRISIKQLMLKSSRAQGSGQSSDNFD